MKVIIQYTTLICLFLLLLIGELPCTPRHSIQPPPPPEEIRSQLGTIGIVSAHFIPESEFVMPASGTGAGARRGLVKGAGIGGSLLSGGGSVGSQGAPCVACFLLPVAGVVVGAVVGAVVGTVVGGVTALPAATVDEAEATLKKALTDIKVQETLMERVVNVARDQTPYLFITIKELGPISPDEQISYCFLATDGINTILEISVLKFGLVGSKWDINPDLMLFMSVRVRFIRVSDGAELYVHTFEFKESKHSFIEWTASNAETFCRELDYAHAILANEIVETLFLSYAP